MPYPDLLEVVYWALEDRTFSGEKKNFGIIMMTIMLMMMELLSGVMRRTTKNSGPRKHKLKKS